MTIVKSLATLLFNKQVIRVRSGEGMSYFLAPELQPLKQEVANPAINFPGVLQIFPSGNNLLYKIIILCAAVLLAHVATYHPVSPRTSSVEHGTPITVHISHSKEKEKEKTQAIQNILEQNNTLEEQRNNLEQQVFQLQQENQDLKGMFEQEQSKNKNQAQAAHPVGKTLNWIKYKLNRASQYIDLPKF
jgi:hypothetical protein